MKNSIMVARLVGLIRKIRRKYSVHKLFPWLTVVHKAKKIVIKCNGVDL